MALTIIEEWDVSRLQHLLRRVSDPASRHVICMLLQQLDGQFNRTEYNQKYADGRYYGTFPCAQSLNGRLRRHYFFGLAVDIDMRNCYCTLLAQLAYQFEVETPYLDEYNLDPKRVQLELADAVGDQTKSAKLFFICMLHGGDLRLSEVDEQLSSCYLQAEGLYPFVRGFRVEMSRVYGVLSAEFPSIHAHATTLAKEARSSNIQGRFFHLLLSIQENRCLMAMKEQVAIEHRSVVGLWYDGLMVWHDDEDEEKNPIDLSVYERRILTETGYRVQLAFKSLEPTEEDVQWLETTGNLRKNELLLSNLEYNTSVRVQPYDRFGTTGNGWLLVSAPMGAGKTYQLMDFVQATFNRKPKSRILIPTNRIIQSVLYRSLLCKLTVNGAPLPVTVYRDPDFMHKAQYGATVVVCEYESLHLLLKASDKNPHGECMAFDCVILDETGGLMSTLVSPTNGFNLRANYMAFCFFLETATKVLCTCADMFLTAVVPEFVLGLVPQSSIRAVVYTTPTVERQYRIYEESKALVAWQELLWDSIRNRLADDTAPNVALLTRTKVAVDSFLYQVKEEFKDVMGIEDMFVTVTRDTTQLEMEAFGDMDLIFNGKIGLVASPKITSATDIQLEHIVFMNLLGIDGASIRSLGQASGRVRKAYGNTIHCLLPHYKPAPLPVEPTKQECLDLINRREYGRVQTINAFKGELETQTRVVPGYEDYGPTVMISARQASDPNLLNLVANITRETKLSGRQYFVSQWNAWVLAKRFLLTFTPGDEDGPTEETTRLHLEAKQAAKDAKLAVKEAHAETEERIFKELLQECQTLGDVDRAYEQMKQVQARDAGLDAQQTVRLTMLSALSKYPHFFRTLTLEQVKYTMRNSSVLYSASVCNLLDPNQMRDLDVVNASRAPLLADSGALSSTVKYIEEILQLGGAASLQRTVDYPIDIDLYLKASNINTFKTLVSKTKDTLKNISSSTIRKSRACKENRAMIKGELRSVLNRIGIRLDPEVARDCSKYRVVPNEHVETLLEHISFRSLDPSAESGSEVIKELVRREKEYSRLLDAVEHSKTNKRHPVTGGGATKRSRR